MMSATRLIASFLVLLLFDTAAARACGFIVHNPNTFREDAAECKLVLYGYLENPQGDWQNGSTDFVITRVVKSHPILAGRTVLRIPRLIAVPDPKKPPHYLVFVDWINGKLDFYRGVTASAAIADYLKGEMEIDLKDRIRVMRYAFEFLDHDDPEIAKDALAEFTRSPDSDIRTLARTLSPERIRKLLRPENTLPSRVRLYALLLGHCGDATDAKQLREILDRRVNGESQHSLDGLFIGYILLAPKDGFEYARGLMGDPDNNFLVRYGVLLAIRYLHTMHPGVVPEKELIAAVARTLVQTDFADLAVSDFRRWDCFEYTEDILGLMEREDSLPIVKRCVVAYAMTSPDPRAQMLIGELRLARSKWIEHAEQMLENENR